MAKEKQNWQIVQANFKAKEIHQTMWEGKADALYLGSSDNTIARPQWVMYSKFTDKIIVCFPHPNNIQIVAKTEDDGNIDLWCEAAVTERELREIRERNEADKVLCES